MERQTKEMIYEETKADIAKRDSSKAPTLNTYDLSDEEIFRLGYMIEESDGQKTYKVLYGFAIKDEQLLQLAFYIDDDKDVEWALETWRSIQGVKE